MDCVTVVLPREHCWISMTGLLWSKVGHCFSDSFEVVDKTWTGRVNINGEIIGVWLMGHNTFWGMLHTGYCEEYLWAWFSCCNANQDTTQHPGTWTRTSSVKRFLLQLCSHKSCHSWFHRRRRKWVLYSVRTLSSQTILDAWQYPLHAAHDAAVVNQT